MNRTWTVPVTFLPGESLSSWLVRAALTQGCDPPVLTGVVWPGWRVWMLDVDRGLPPERLKALARVSGVPADEFAQAALRVEAERVAGRPLPEHGAWPWVLALGPRNRKRMGRLSYCPACLAEDARPYFLRAWRFAWQVGCPHHQAALTDGCPRCGAPIEPHRLVAEDRHQARCPRCRADLRESAIEPFSPLDLAFQEWAGEVMREGAGRWGEEVLPVPAWFALARYLVSLVRYAGRYPESAAARTLRLLAKDRPPEPPISPALLPATGLPFELLRVSERRALLAWVKRVLEASPQEIAGAALEAGLTRAALRNAYTALPRVIAETFASLPEDEKRVKKAGSARSKPPRPRSRRTVKAAWARLQRKITLVKDG